MAERELSGKDLLDQLYRGLDTVQPTAVEAEMDAHELLGIAPVRSADSASAKAFAPAKASASRTKLTRSSWLLLCGIAVGGTIAAAAVLHQPEPPAPVAQVVVAPPSPPPEPVAAVVPPPQQIQYVEVVNPFDKTEVFKFPPGTSKADARDQMAQLLLQRAIERKAHVPSRNRKLASDRHPTATGRGS
jgi:hypothetical protein